MENKKCLNHCPKCNSKNIDWGRYEGDNDCLWQDAECLDCGHSFREVYQYSHTEDD